MSFNTSHVTLYPVTLQWTSLPHLFQYISCYSLSQEVWQNLLIIFVSIHLMLLFIGGLRSFTVCIICFNTSHVTLYLMQICQIQARIGSFNTSHVTLYQLCRTTTGISRTCFNTSHVTLYPSFFQSFPC